jgi:hypothetical protein
MEIFVSWSFILLETRSSFCEISLASMDLYFVFIRFFVSCIEYLMDLVISVYQKNYFSSLRILLLSRL